MQIITDYYSKAISANKLKTWLNLTEHKELAVIDVREHGQYGEGHLFFGVNVPYSRLEKEIVRLVPNTNTCVVVYDDNDGVAQKSIHRLQALGYENTYYVDGGAQAWVEAGYHLFAGVNLPSKTFGELVEHKLDTPRITAQDLQAKLVAKENVVVLDGRTFKEYKKMSIPTASSCPNGELALRVHQFTSDPETTVIINCAGRTRSIIGAQTLINFGLKNQVLALENGTQGWYLNDLQLEHGSERKYTDSIDQEVLPELQNMSKELASKKNVQYTDIDELNNWFADSSRNTFLFDIRTPEEFASATIAGAEHAEGGQLIQATDLFVGVQGARIVVFDTEGVRAPVVASWLTQMGWDAYVLNADLTATIVRNQTAACDLKLVPSMDAKSLAKSQNQLVLLDARPSMDYRKAHIQGAQWVIRPRLQNLQLELDKDIVVIASDEMISQLIALELQEKNISSNIFVHTGTPDDWSGAGLALAHTPDNPSDSECIDYLFFVHDRHHGNKEAAIQYLAWETNLLNQVDEQELRRFSIS